MSQNNPSKTKANTSKVRSISKTRSIAFWVKAISFPVAFLLLSLAWLLFTSSGAKTAIELLNRNQDSLAIKGVEGALLSDLTLQDIRLTSDAVKGSLAHASIKVQPWCLLRAEICIESVLINKPHFNVLLKSKQSSEEEDEQLDEIESPIAIQIDSLEIENFQVILLSNNEKEGEIVITNRRLQLQELSVSDSFDDNSLNIGSLALDGLQVAQSAGVSDAAIEKDNALDLARIRNWQYQPPDLPKLFIPLALNLDTFIVSNFEYLSGGQSVMTINNLETKVSADNSSGVSVNINTMQSPELALEADIELTPDWQTKISIEGEPDSNFSTASISLFAGDWQLTNSSPDFGTRFGRFRLNVSGNLDDMQVSAKVLSSNNLELISTTAEISPAQRLLPARIQINWRDLSLEKASGKQGIAPIHFTNGKLHLEGNLNQYTLVVKSENNTQYTNTVSLGSIIELQLGEKKSASIKNTQVTSQYASIALSADTTLRSELAFNAELSVDNTDAAAFLQDLTTIATDVLPEAISVSLDQLELTSNITLSGKLSESFPDTPQRLSITSEITSSANWLQRPLSFLSDLNLELAVNTPESYQVEVSNLSLKLGDNQLNAFAAMDISSIAADIAMDVQDLSQIVARGSGMSSLTLKANGPIDKPNINSLFEASNLKWMQYSAERIGFESVLNWEKSAAFRLQGEIHQAAINDVLIDAGLKTAGDLENHQIGLSVTSDMMNSNLRLAGGFGESHWQGELVTGELGFRELIIGEAGAAQATPDESELNQSQFIAEPQVPIYFGWKPMEIVVSPHCWRHLKTDFCAQQLSFKDNEVLAGLSGQNLPLLRAVKPFVPVLKQVNSTSVLNFNSDLHWRLSGLPQWQVNAEFSPAQWYLADELEAVNVETLRINSRTHKNQIDTHIELAGPQLGSIDTKLALTLPAKLSKIKLASESNVLVETELSIERLDVSPFLSLIPGLQSGKGLINGSLQGGWKQKRPVLTGTLQISDGDIITENLGIRLSGINQSINFDQSEASILGSFVLGGGKGELSGQLDWWDNPSVNLTVKGAELGFQDGEEYAVSFSPDLTINASTKGADLTGSLSVPSAQVKIKSLPETVVLPSSDVVLVDSENMNTKSSYPVNLSVELAIDPQKNRQVTLEAFGLNTAIQGALSVKGSTDRLSATGEINLQNGRYEAWGQQLLIQDGELRFSGPVDEPFLYARAVRDPAYTEDKVIAGLLVEGQARKPSVSIYSEPEMSQAQALSYLTRGKSLGAKSTDSDQAILTGMLLNFGLSQSENRIGSIGRKVGIDDLSVDMSGQGDNTKVAVSGSLSDRVKVSYGVGVFSAISEVSLRLQILPQLYLEAVSGLTNAVDLYYQFDDEEQTPQTDTSSTSTSE